jgi:steroid delta-isomerase-like uncharacterized protein
MFSDRLKAAWDSHDPKAVAALYTPNGARTNLVVEEERIEGRDAIVAFTAEVFEAFPDCTVEIRKQSGSGATLTVEWIFRATQVKDFKTIPGKGQSIALAGVAVYEMDGDLVREDHSYWDNATLLAAAGLLA